jgi:Ca2+-binding EF-hand superfamily protein
VGKHIKAFFEKADADFNGTVDFSELMAVVKKMKKGSPYTKPQDPKRSLSKGEWQAFFSKHDINGDRELQFHEFQKLLIDVYQTHALACPGFTPQ